MDNQFNPYQQNYHEQQPFEPHPMKRTNMFETISMVLAILGLLCCTCFYGAYIFGALAILFALLSRGGQMQLSANAKFGLIAGIIAIILTTVVTIGAFIIAWEQYGSLEGIIQEYCNLYGLDYNEFMEMYGY